MLELMSESFGNCNKLGCDSVIIQGSIKQSEIDIAGIPREALEHFPSSLFSVRLDIVNYGYISFPLILADDV